jgi:hypothetical protein
MATSDPALYHPHFAGVKNLALEWSLEIKLVCMLQRWRCSLERNVLIILSTLAEEVPCRHLIVLRQKKNRALKRFHLEKQVSKPNIVQWYKRSTM